MPISVITLQVNGRVWRRLSERWRADQCSFSCSCCLWSTEPQLQVS